MSYANGTTHYNLPQTLGTDKRDWFDTNQPFADIDAALYAAATGQAADAEAIVEINQKLVTDEQNITALQTLTNTHTSQISTLQTTVNSHSSQIADTRQDAEDMITAFNEGAAETSTHAYAIGDYFIYNDVLYRATAAIAIGDTIVPNTNCEATNVTTEIATLNSDLSNVSTDLTNLSDSIHPSAISVTGLNYVTVIGSRAYKTGRIISLNALIHYGLNIPAASGFQTFATMGSDAPTSRIYFSVSTYSGNVGTGRIEPDGNIDFDFPNGYTADDDVVVNVAYVN